MTLHQIVDPSWRKIDDSSVDPKRPIFRTAISSETGPVKILKKTLLEITCGYTSVPIYGSKSPHLGGQKNSTKISKNVTFILEAPPDAPEGVAPPTKMVPPYSLGTCPPKAPQATLTPHRSFME